MGDENNPTNWAAVRNSGQKVDTGSGELRERKKATIVVNSVRRSKLCYNIGREAMANTCASSRGNT